MPRNKFLVGCVVLAEFLALSNRTPAQDPTSNTQVVEAQVESTGADAAFTPLSIGGQYSGKKSVYTLLLRNETGAPLKIKLAKPQCGCTVFKLKPTVLNEGDYCPIDFTIDVPKTAFPKESYYVTLETEGAVSSILLKMDAAVAGSLAFTTTPPVFRLTPELYLKRSNEEQVFDVAFSFSEPIKQKEIVVEKAGEIEDIDWKIEKVDGKYFVRGKCSYSQVMPGTSVGTLRLKAANGKSVEQLITITNPGPAEISPKEMEFVASDNGELRGEGFLKVVAEMAGKANDEEVKISGKFSDPRYNVVVEVKKLSFRIYRLNAYLKPNDSKLKIDKTEESPTIQWKIEKGGFEVKELTKVLW